MYPLMSNDNSLCVHTPISQQHGDGYSANWYKISYFTAHCGIMLRFMGSITTLLI